MLRFLIPLLMVILLGAAPPPAPPSAPPAAKPPPKDKEKKPVIEEVEIAGEIFKLEVAADALARAKGLSGRKKIDDDGGMIFVYPYEKRLSFWMIDCLVDIDIIFLDRRGRITARHEMKAEPLQQPGERRVDYERRLKRYSSRRPTQYAIELKAGSIKRLKLEDGQRIELDFKKLRKMAKP